MSPSSVTNGIVEVVESYGKVEGTRVPGVDARSFIDMIAPDSCRVIVDSDVVGGVEIDWFNRASSRDYVIMTRPERSTPGSIQEFFDQSSRDVEAMREIMQHGNSQVTLDVVRELSGMLGALGTISRRLARNSINRGLFDDPEQAPVVRENMRGQIEVCHQAMELAEVALEECVKGMNDLRYRHTYAETVDMMIDFAEVSNQLSPKNPISATDAQVLGNALYYIMFEDKVGRVLSGDSDHQRLWNRLTLAIREIKSDPSHLYKVQYAIELYEHQKRLFPFERWTYDNEKAKFLKVFSSDDPKAHYDMLTVPDAWEVHRPEIIDSVRNGFERIMSAYHGEARAMNEATYAVEFDEAPVVRPIELFKP